MREYDSSEKGLPQLVVSLHDCDIATDIVLAQASRWNTRVILSTPCCHHALAHVIDCPELGFVTEHPFLSRKLCDALTDAARLKLLESKGYSVTALELTDPDDTPKNVLLRAVLNKNASPSRLAESRRLLLNAAAVCHYKMAAGKNIMKIHHRKRLAEAHRIASGKNLLRRFSNRRIRMNGI